MVGEVAEGVRRGFTEVLFFFEIAAEVKLLPRGLGGF